MKSEEVISKNSRSLCSREFLVEARGVLRRCRAFRVASLLAHVGENSPPDCFLPRLRRPSLFDSPQLPKVKSTAFAVLCFCLKRDKRCLNRGKNEEKVSEKIANYKCESCFIDKSFSYFMLIDLCSAILTIYHTFSISVLKSITHLPI